MKCVSGKTSYDSEMLAKEALIQNHIKNNHRKGSGPINYYQCNDCGNWHFTSKGEMHFMFRDKEIQNRIEKEQRIRNWESKF